MAEDRDSVDIRGSRNEQTFIDLDSPVRMFGKKKTE